MPLDGNLPAGRSNPSDDGRSPAASSARTDHHDDPSRSHARHRCMCRDSHRDHRAQRLDRAQPARRAAQPCCTTGWSRRPTHPWVGVSCLATGQTAVRPARSGSRWTLQLVRRGDVEFRHQRSRRSAPVWRSSAGRIDAWCARTAIGAPAKSSRCRAASRRSRAGRRVRRSPGAPRSRRGARPTTAGRCTARPRTAPGRITELRNDFDLPTEPVRRVRRRVGVQQHDCHHPVRGRCYRDPMYTLSSGLLERGEAAGKRPGSLTC